MVSKTPQALENKSSMQMFVRLLQANKKIPITEETISWSISKKQEPWYRGKCTAEGWTTLEHSREASDSAWHGAASQVAHRIISSAQEPPHRSSLQVVGEHCALLLTGSRVTKGTNNKSSKARGRGNLFPLLCMLSKFAAFPKITANTMTTPLNFCWLGSGRWVWERGQAQGQAGTPLHSNCCTANCRFHSWVEHSKRHPSTLSSELLSWCSFLPTVPPSKTVYRWKDGANSTYIFANIAVWNRRISKASLWHSPHVHGHYHKS